MYAIRSYYAYRAGQQPEQLLGELLRAQSLDDAAWISLIDAHTLAAECARLQARLAEAGSLAALPLYGVPFAVKDNIDVAGLPTTAACPAFRYLPEQDAGVVARLRAAGAVVLGKSNLDQFATGLVGTRDGVLHLKRDEAILLLVNTLHCTEGTAKC